MNCPRASLMHPRHWSPAQPGHVVYAEPQAGREAWVAASVRLMDGGDDAGTAPLWVIPALGNSTGAKLGVCTQEGARLSPSSQELSDGACRGLCSTFVGSGTRGRLAGLGPRSQEGGRAEGQVLLPVPCPPPPSWQVLGGLWFFFSHDVEPKAQGSPRG